MLQDYNLLNIFKTRHYLKNKKNQKYYPYSGVETYLGEQRRRKNINSSKKN